MMALAKFLTGRPGTNKLDFTTITDDAFLNWLRYSPKIQTLPPVLVMLWALVEHRGLPNSSNFKQYDLGLPLTTQSDPAIEEEADGFSGELI